MCCSLIIKISFSFCRINVSNLCRGGSVSVGDTEVRFFADEWSEVHQLIPLVNDGETDKKGGYDIILMAETLYSISAQKRLYELIKRCLAYHDGAVYMAAKKYYFGVGGGTRQFLSMIEKDGKNGLYKERIVFVHPQHHP
ncbi:hypothetical protein YC2023_117480 [Brassica napus]|uniref:Histidine protein methyltransferase 1 homolog n=1 Tax=Brassica oleracea TaxID=3712 RepID=A0A3P6EJY4_BRAOL|nr:unnamed protein product [Brassica oleracea]